MIINGGDLEINRRSFFIRYRFYNKYNIDSAETDNLQSINQINLIFSINNFNKTHLSITRFFEQALILMAISASNLFNINKNDLMIIDILKFTAMKIFNKQLNASKIKYKYKLKSL
jgi:hypothetical protein